MYTIDIPLTEKQSGNTHYWHCYPYILLEGVTTHNGKINALSSSMFWYEEEIFLAGAQCHGIEMIFFFSNIIFLMCQTDH